MDVMSFDPLELAAESTIAAAAAAMLWCGEDRHGVLAHIAGRSAWKMATSRRVQMYVVETHPECVGECYDDQVVQPSEFDMAAMPAWGARKWAARVAAAVCECERKVGRLTEASERRGESPLALGTLRCERTKLAALQTIALWGRDPLPQEQIEAAARAVTTDGIEVPA
jgi:hypothetical protein